MELNNGIRYPFIIVEGVKVLTGVHTVVNIKLTRLCTDPTLSYLLTYYNVVVFENSF